MESDKITESDITRLLDEGLFVPSEDRDALEAGSWHSYVLRRYPPEWTDPIGWFSFFLAARSAAATPVQSEPVHLTIAPVWYGEAFEPPDAGHWNLRLLMSINSGERFEWLEVRKPVIAVMSGEVFDARMPVPLSGYAPSIRSRVIEASYGTYGVVRSRRVYRIVKVDEAFIPEILPRPDLELASFSQEARLAVPSELVDEALREAIFKYPAGFS